MSLERLLENLWGLFEAAEVREPDLRSAFEDLYLRLTAADDARQSWMPPGLGSDSDVEQALDALYEWAGEFGHADDERPASKGH